MPFFILDLNMRLKIFIGLLLAGITLAIYWPVTHYGLVYYDDPLFLENAEIQSGLNWHSFAWAFTSVMIANWHPITNLSFVLDHQFFGTNPGAEHLVNLLFHTANAVLLFLVLSRMTNSPWRSAIVAAIFAWHPLRVESVAWISERKDVLFGFFLLLSLYCYVKAATSDKCRGTNSDFSTIGLSPWYWPALFFFALSLMSKAMAVTLPFLLVLLDFWPLKRVAGGERPVARFPKFRGLIVEKVPFFALTGIFCALTFEIQKKFAAMSSLNQVGIGDRIGNVVMSYWRYLAKMVWPVDLAVIYPHPSSSFETQLWWPDWQLWAGAALLLLISGLFIKLILRKPYLAVGWFWFLGTMLPVIGLVQVGETAMADRYTYLPLIGPAIALVWGISEILARGIFQKLFRGFLTAASLAVVIILTHRQIGFWKDTVALFAHAIAVTGENPSAECGLATGLEHENREGSAMVHYRVALGIVPGYREAQYHLARLLARNGHWPEAAENFSEIVGNSPSDFEAQLGLSGALAQLGRAAESVEHLETALQYAPDSTEVLNNLAWMLATSSDASLRDGKRAVELAERACELSHYKKTIYVGTLAAAYAEAGRFDDAIVTAQKACALAEKAEDQTLLQKNQQLLELYRAHKPFHESAENW